MLKQHRELSLFARRTIENNEEAEIRPSKTYQSFVAVASSHCKLSFIEKDVRNYITKKVWNVSEQDDTKEFGKFSHRDTVCNKSAIETQFQHVYTQEKFREVQSQFREKVNCITRSMHSTLVSREVKCQCLLFESREHKKRKHTYIKSSQDEPLLEPESKKFDDLVFQSHNICKFVSESEELTEILHRAFDNVMTEMQEYQAKSKGKSLLSHKDTTLSDVNDLQSPPRVRTRGRPKNRLGSNKEKKIANATKKKKKPALSELNILDDGSMIQATSSLYDAQDMNYAGEDYRTSSSHITRVI
ncbi:hypothetical protein Ahy_A07g033629 [Arachis hypogaea]|uniref:Protein FAR1-RELATED SEQUENCE n=1 Tax=Arachis hypogaea TaxID=3818 RepID=A0A445C9R8_ARAHY|nr:hypothetical protein Ahy_A07g033629 [Arachis hypogaea]